jgi:hypothetical protein
VALLLLEPADLVEGDLQRVRWHPPAEMPHRLVECIFQVEQSAAALEHGSGVVTPAAAVELKTLLMLVEEIGDEPTKPLLLASLKSPDDYAHTLIVLIAEKVHRDLGNLVVFEPPRAESRTPDLRVLAAEGRSIALEVKAPRRLRTGQPLAGQKEAGSIVSYALERTGVGEGGQLTPDYCGHLVIGGFGLNERSRKLLRKEGEAVFRRRVLGHIWGITFISLGTHMNDVDMSSGVPKLTRNTS